MTAVRPDAIRPPKRVPASSSALDRLALPDAH